MHQRVKIPLQTGVGMPMVTKLNFKLCVLSSVSMRGTHNCAIDLNSVLGYSIKPIFTGSDAIGDLGTSDLVAIGRHQWRERESNFVFPFGNP